MGKIVAIGGGEIGRPDCPAETTQIDQEIIRLTGKGSPKILFIPTASTDSENYIEAFHRHFGDTLGCETDTLCLINDKSLTAAGIEDKILGADAVYVGGGNTAKMLRLWHRLGVDSLLKQAYERGTVLSGLSAGAICWFRYGSSDSRRFTNPGAGLMRLSGLDLVRATACPHYDVEESREGHLKDLMRKTPGAAIALDNCCAIELIDDSYRIVSSTPTAGAYRVFWSRGEYLRQPIAQTEEYRPLAQLLAK